MPGQKEEISDKAVCAAFRDAGDFIRRPICCDGHTLFVYAIDGLIASSAATEYVIKPAMERLCGSTTGELYKQALEAVIYNVVTVPCEDLRDVTMKLVNGFCVLLFPGTGAIAFEVKTPDKRGTSAPEVENTVKGPKDAFVETVRSNTSYIRRHLRTPDLRLYETQVGRRSLTNVSILWVEGITNPEMVEHMKQRLSSIDVDGFITPAAVEQYVTGSRATAFPLVQYTERTDRFCQGLLDGRVGLLVDGLPLGYLAPADLGFLMESPEDRSIDYVNASCVKVLRYVALLFSLLLPAVFVAMASFHQEMIPLPLLKAIIESKQSVPFSTAVEVVGLLVAFELLQESGIHLPQAIGQSVSIIGGIVVGTAAVEAKLVSPVALIAVSIAGVCGFVQPNRDFAEAVRVWRFLFTVLGSIGGLFGVSVGLIVLLIHLSGLTCLGVSYLEPFSTVKNATILRSRLVKDKFRTEYLNPEDGRNQK